MRKPPYTVLLAAVVAMTLYVLVPGRATWGRTNQSDGSSVALLVRGPYLGSVTQNSIVISWTTSDPVLSIVQYGEGKLYGFSVTDSLASVLHSVTLTGLIGNHLYYYRVIAGPDTGADFSFWTAPDLPVSFDFVVYGDTRSNHQAHVRVLKQIFKTKPRFIINTGDLVARNTESNWDDYFADLCQSTTLGQTIPVYACPGNHDYGQMYYDNLYLPHNNPQNSEAYYSFEYGDVHVVSVNTEIKYDAASAQYKWLIKDLESPSAQQAAFRVVFWHRPPYSSGSGHGSDLEARGTLVPLMKKDGVDIVFNGHDHTYERTKPIDGTTYIVTGGGGAPLYGFRDSNEWTAYKETGYHFCLVSVDSLTMRVRMIRDDGAEHDSLIILKRRRASQDPAIR